MNIEAAMPGLDDLAIDVPERVLFQEVGEETVLLDIENGEYYGLNEVGSKLWTLLQQGHTMREAVSTMLKEYDVSEECLRSDIQQFLLQLQTKGLIKIVAGPQNERSPT